MNTQEIERLHDEIIHIEKFLLFALSIAVYSSYSFSYEARYLNQINYNQVDELSNHIMNRLYGEQYLYEINPVTRREDYQKIRLWEDMIWQSAGLTDRQKLKRVNEYFNRIDYAEDMDIWNQGDYWANVFEFMFKNAGDCEDFAAAKYFTLLEMGVTPSRLQMHYVKTDAQNSSHIVLLYFDSFEQDPLVLDNLEPDVSRKSKRDDLKFLDSIDSNQLVARYTHQHLMNRVKRSDYMGGGSRG